ncbi:type II toxin-antitoxin system RelE/ParE family toxin [Ensifer soli]|uniref:type II toxin-antitoxin system RelE/ParE family toxin n=1 Tax=Ciceribacter sp. sgz301302 TaxID=3342379 RepID=UPI0035BA4D11
MQRVKVTYRPGALADLRKIFDDIRDLSGSGVTARRFVDRIMARCRKIGDAPHGGRPRDDLALGLRTIPFERSAVIAYVVGKTVDIVGVYYGGRDYEALYQSGEGEDGA